ncbi:hypothetical protein AB6A40_005987 [Gnathostoma spinigerum]|uniref:Uncharacterized protein n=1 Tax=Gnathostoma spinigerum TaxID=75299 RepID=A0ABD6EH91_9BILA
MRCGDSVLAVDLLRVQNVSDHIPPRMLEKNNGNGHGLQRISELLGSPQELSIKLLAVLCKLVFFIYDVLTFIPYQIFDNPDTTLQLSKRIKAKPTIEGDPSSPWRCVEYKKDAKTQTIFPGCDTLGKVSVILVKI